MFDLLFLERELWGLFGRYMDIGMVIVASICMGIAVDDTIHFLSSYVKFRKAGESKSDALKRVLDHTGVALVSTTLVLIAGFGVFVFCFWPLFWLA